MHSLIKVKSECACYCIMHLAMYFKQLILLVLLDVILMAAHYCTVFRFREHEHRTGHSVTMIKTKRDSFVIMYHNLTNSFI